MARRRTLRSDFARSPRRIISEDGIFIYKFDMNCISVALMFCVMTFTVSTVSTFRTYDIDKVCKVPELKNGKVRTKQRGKLARFQCFWNYELLGQRYSVCVKGKWDTPTPICIKPGCKNVSSPKNGVRVYSKKNATAMFFCNPGYLLEGSAQLHCNGQNWNDTTPKCLASEKRQPLLSCDFESTDLCGWSADPTHDFDWVRQTKPTPEGCVRPMYDHTKGFEKNGTYMCIETSSRVENDTARLISPVFSSNLTQFGCFVFHYFMERTTGILRVLMVPEDEDLSFILSDSNLTTKRTMFERNGDQGDIWLKGFFEFDEMETDFQIVIEGIKGPGYFNDIAVDDVSLLQGPDCLLHKWKYQQEKLQLFADSCINRCGNAHVEMLLHTPCSCSDGCEMENSCCMDYRYVCVFGSTDDGYTNATEESISASTYDMDVQNIESSTSSEYYTSTQLKTTLKRAAENLYNATQIIKNISLINTSIKPTTISTSIQTSSFSVTNTIGSNTTPKTESSASKKTTKSTTIQVLNTSISSIINITIPTLQFMTKPPPIKNATGRLDKLTTNYKKVNLTLPMMRVTKKPTTTAQSKTSSVTKPVQKDYSKTYAHYGKNENGTNTATTKRIIFRINATHSAKIVFKKDEIDNSSSDSSAGPISILSIVLIAASILTLALVLMTIIKNGTLIREIERMKSRANTYFRPTSDGTDIRFLVEDETLSHDIDE